MLSSYQGIPGRSRFYIEDQKQKLVGYVLTARRFEQNIEVSEGLERKCQRAGHRLKATEWDVGTANNPIRIGLWNVLRRVICDRCPPRRMSFSILNFDDFLDQALAPCRCGNQEGLDGIVLTTIHHLSSRLEHSTNLILRLARLGKHLIADDGVCLSCCHPVCQALVCHPSSEPLPVMPPAQPQHGHYQSWGAGI